MCQRVWHAVGGTDVAYGGTDVAYGGTDATYGVARATRLWPRIPTCSYSFLRVVCPSVLPYCAATLSCYAVAMR
eukprot:936754-Rhodomonas_salina.13